VNKRTIVAICLLTAVASLGFLLACVEAHSSYEVLSFNMTPPSIATGEKVTIEAQVRNINSKTDIFNIPLMVNGVANDRKSITLAPGEIELLTFELTINHAGSYKISIADKESTLIVENPPPSDFRLSNLEINPTEVNTGENVVITAKIVNAGGTQGSYTAELKINGVTEQSEKLIIPAGTNYMLVFKISKDLPGTYIVTIGDLTDWYVVNEPPKPVISPPCPPSSSCGPGG
jgi:hypothetical protein